MRSAQSLIFLVNSIRLNHSEPDRKARRLIARMVSERRSSEPADRPPKALPA